MCGGLRKKIRNWIAKKFKSWKMSRKNDGEAVLCKFFSIFFVGVGKFC